MEFLKKSLNKVNVQENTLYDIIYDLFFYAKLQESEENIKNVLRQKDTSKGIFFIYNEYVKYEDIVKQKKEIYNYKTDERVQDLNAGGVLYLH